MGGGEGRKEQPNSRTVVFIRVLVDGGKEGKGAPAAA